MTSPAVVEHFAKMFEKMFSDDLRLMTISELSRRVGRDRGLLGHAMNLWESSHGAWGLAFVRLSSDIDNNSRYTCMKAWDDFVRRGELDSAKRGVLGYRGARYR